MWIVLILTQIKEVLANMYKTSNDNSDYLSIVYLSYDHFVLTGTPINVYCVPTHIYRAVINRSS